MFEQFGDNALMGVWHVTEPQWPERERKESKEQQPSKKQQMAALTSKNSKVFIDEAFETG